MGFLFVATWVRGLVLAKRQPPAVGDPDEAKPGMGVGAPSAIQVAIGFVTNFFDTLGVGSFATTTAAFRFLKQVPDRVIPGTLNIGHTLPTIAQAYFFTQAVHVETKTLITMIIAAILGAWFGAGFVCRWSKRKVQIGMGLALLGIGAVITIRQVFNLNRDDAPLGLEGEKLWIGAAANFALGSLMTIGIGLYAPCLVLVSILGMDPRAGFPIMMSSCAFLMPIASVRFLSTQSYAPRAALGLALGGVPAVWIVVQFVKEMNIYTINWIVVGVVAYTAATMLHSALSKPKTA